jgi:hypothetical protein
MFWWRKGRSGDDVVIEGRRVGGIGRREVGELRIK